MNYEYCFIHNIYPGDVMRDIRHLYTVTGNVSPNHFNAVLNNADTHVTFRCPIDVMISYKKDITHRLKHFNKENDIKRLRLVLDLIQEHFVLGVDFSVDKKGKLYALK